MRRRPKHQIPTKYILLSMTALCILAMYVSFSLNLGGGPLNSIAGAIFEPMQKGINYAGTWLSDKADNLKNLNDVMEENEQLKGQVEELTNELNTIKLEQYELDNLRRTVSFRPAVFGLQENRSKCYRKGSGQLVFRLHH